MDSVKFDGLLKEKIYFKTLSSGLKCYIIQKAGFVDKQAIIGVNYGSVDNEFKIGQKKNVMPQGIAHFLEHKMFENKKFNVFDEFSKLGASVNAFTNFSNTAYYFTCDDNFYKSLSLLLKFTSEPHLTNENVEKEKGIISQEIEMYDDNPFWIMHLNLLYAMYKTCPIKNNIAGSVSSINEITKEQLLDCYHTFYRPSNMVLVCVGDVSPEEVVYVAEKHSKPIEKIAIDRLYGKEPKSIVKNYAEKNMSLARPMFQIGFKDTDFQMSYIKKVIASKIVLDIVSGESSTFFEELYNDKLIDGPFVIEYISGLFYGTAVFSNTSDRPREVANRLLGELSRIRMQGLNKVRFEQIRKKHLGRYVRSFNSIDNIATGQMEFSFKGIDLFDAIKAYHSLTYEEIELRFKKLLREDNYVTSVVSPYSS